MTMVLTIIGAARNRFTNESAEKILRPVIDAPSSSMTETI